MSSSTPSPGPPRVLLGAALLFWGGISGNPTIGLIAAIATEAAHWTRIRWNFSDETFYRAWQTSVIILLFAAVLIWLDSSILSALPRTVVWLPVILFPLQFVQSYGMQQTMPTATFSMFVRKRRAHAERHGLPFRDIRFSFGYVYFATIIVATAVGTHANSFIFFPGLLILILWVFHRQFTWSKRLAPFSALLVLAISAAGAYSGEQFLEYIYRRYAMGAYGLTNLNDYRQTRTAIGMLGEIKQSPNILWRLMPLEGKLPTHLRIASYNSYRNTSWNTTLPPDIKTGSDDFPELESVGLENPFRISARKDATSFISAKLATDPKLSRFILRGAFARKGLLPIPGNSASLILPAQNMEINSFGTLRVDPTHPVANATILWDGPLTTAKPPWKDRHSRHNSQPDLRIPKDEADAIRRVAEQLELEQGSLAEKIERIRNHFYQHFTYTRYLSQARPGNEQNRRHFVGDFLEQSRRGHCEYYATATTFLLRHAGIPARYATGFAVVELDPKTGDALVRGTHAHAWCMAWDAQQNTWITVDLTPPDWTGLESPRMPIWQGLLDRWQILRDNLIVWRTQPGNLAIAIFIILIPLIIATLLIGRRLWRSRHRIDPVASRRKVRPQQAVTPLSDIEKLATRLLGPRPMGMPLGPWLSPLASQLNQPASLNQAIDLHRSLRFDPDADSSHLRQQLSTLVIGLSRELKSIPIKQI